MVIHLTLSTQWNRAHLSATSRRRTRCQHWQGQKPLSADRWLATSCVRTWHTSSTPHSCHVTVPSKVSIVLICKPTLWHHITSQQFCITTIHYCVTVVTYAVPNVLPIPCHVTKCVLCYCRLGNNTGQYVGCFKDDIRARIFPGTATNLQKSNTPKKCVNLCLQTGQSLYTLCLLTCQCLYTLCVLT